LPKEFRVTAETDDGVVMAIEHESEPVAAVQFHPESIMTLGQDAGMRMIENVVAHLARKEGEGSMTQMLKMETVFGTAAYLAFPCSACRPACPRHWRSPWR
jgi:carbamoylphosphate synthase small subunit